MNHNRKIVGIIPARYASSRFPGKPLAKIRKKPMIQWVYEASADVFDYLVIATDDVRIMDAAKRFKANVILTSSDHTSGTERCLEVVEKLKTDKGLEFDYVINIQGDEPLLKKEQLNELKQCLIKNETGIATLAKPFSKDEDPEDPNCVKVVL
ncbi:cytidylyltransferase domain-containing protein, partial [Bacteroidota bacterium]